MFTLRLVRAQTTEFFLLKKQSVGDRKELELKMSQVLSL